MDSGTLTIRQISPEADSHASSRKANPKSSRRHHQAASPTTGQTRPPSGGPKETGLREEPEPSDQAERANGGASVIPTDLYPLSGFLRSVLAQERALWERNELLLKSLKNGRAAEGDAELDSHSGTSLHDGTSGDKRGEETDTSKEPFHFIRYGQLTSNIHKYFRRLEKRHACLHLTARRAKHETIRHVERTVGGNQPKDPPPSSSLIQQAVAAGSSQAVTLRDDELLVYRCALMCSQFPMLSAPNPPDGHSPTPSPPPLPSMFSTSALQYSQTVPTEFQTEADVHESSSTDSSTKRPALSTSLTSSNVTISSAADASSNMVDGGKPITRNATAVAASEPIPIKSGASNRIRMKSKSIKKHSTLASEGSDTSALAKLPPGDSDEEAELVKLVNAKTSSGSESSPTGREHPFSPMVNREMLYGLVRQAFKQSEEQQVNFEGSLKREYGRRSKGEILAKELAGQLQVLDNNAHPFYKPKLFVTRNGYDLWLQGEKERVRKLIDKFWHCSLPRPQLWRNFNPIDYHRLYTILLRKIVDCESRTNRREPVHSGRTPSSPLSPTAQRLLTEFGLRYGVGDLYRRIVYLEYLAKHFDYEIWYIKHCTEELRAIRLLLPRNRNRITAVRPEMEMLRSTVYLLHGQADNSLTRVDRLFLDSDPRKGVASLIELLAEVLDAQQNLFGKRIQTVEKWLKRYLKSGFVLRYERRKEIASDETMISSQTVQPFVLTPTLVNSLLLGTRDEVYDFRDKYQSVFRPYFDVVPFSKLEFYRLLCADACSLCARKLHKESNRKTLNLEMLGLMYRLNERDIEWQGVIEPEHQLWRQHYQNMACVWLDILGQQINNWTISAVENDKWTFLTFDAPYPRVASMMSVHSSYQGDTTRNAQIMASVRISPFPSPAPTMQRGEESLIPTGGIGGRQGAFTPYKQVMKKQRVSPILSESSGAVTDSLLTSGGSPVLDASSSTSIAGEVPRLFRGPTKKSSPVSIVTFGPGEQSRDQEREHEVAVSVYSDGEEEDEMEANLDEGGPVAVQDSIPKASLPKPAASTEYVTAASEISGSVRAQHSMDSGSHAFPPAGTSDSKDVSLASTVVGGVSEHVKSTENGSTGQLSFPIDASVRVQAAPQATAPLTDSLGQSMKFNNLLDKCDASDSDTVVKSKPTAFQRVAPYGENLPQLLPPGGPFQPSRMENRSQLSTVSRTAATVSPPMINSPETLHEQTSPETSPSPLDGMNEDLGTLQPFLFPVSNSPVDLITMLSRLASFTGGLLAVLTPKIRKTGFTRNKVPSTDGYAPEVNKARQQASERQRDAKSIKIAFLKRLNRVFISSLKLYTDNLLCMDLCGWTSSEANKLLGEPELHHLSRRKELGEIWGCRHMVEAKHGWHPNGIPCAKKHTDMFERITRDMCIRINNVHVLITSFHSLEDHLYSLIRTDSQKPISAFGYVSSDPSEATPNMRLLRTNTSKPNPARTRLNVNGTRDTSSLPSTVSSGLGAMEPDRQEGTRYNADRNKEEPEDLDSTPMQSRECLEYLRKVQDFQVKMIAIRMNKFCKIALSELLSLKLVDCQIEKRLFPVVNYLERHRVALKKYVYPQCFAAIMEHVWENLLQDLEDEAQKLRTNKRPVTDRAQRLLQALAHLIQFMHNKNEGLDIDRLNLTSEYLQGMLDIMSRSTDQLINIFHKLSNAHFSRNVLDLSQAPVVVDSRVLSQLRQQLRSDKKCFTGKEFVSKVMEIGRGAMVEDLERGIPGSTSSPPVLSPTGQRIEYNMDYASSVAQYLLDEGVLIHIFHEQSLSYNSSILITPQHTSIDDSQLASSYEGKEFTDSVRRLGVNSAISFTSGMQSTVSFASGPSDSASALDSPGQSRRSAGSARAPSTETRSTMNTPYQYGRDQSAARQRLHRERSGKPLFTAETNVYYKFAGSEDDEFAFFQSQVLMSSVHHSLPDSSAGSLLSSNQDFLSARMGTLCLVYDLLSQRARKERVAKQFINSPRVQEQRRQAAAGVNCDLIFKM